MKTSTVIELCDNGKIFKGRLLGLVNDKEFHALMKKKRFQNKVFSCRTIPLVEIVDNYPKLNGLRLVLAAQELDGEMLIGKQLFVTEKLNYVANVDNGVVGILGEKDEYYVIREETS